MKLITTVVALLVMVAGLQAATLTGTVTDNEDNPLENARVALHGGDHGGGHHGGGMGMLGDYETWTDSEGNYLIEGIEEGTYEARAMLTGYGMQEEELAFASDQDLTQDFVLTTGGHGGGHMGGEWDHEWEEVELSGTTIVEDNGANHDDFYYLDTDGDEAADYQLGFGPEGYEPESGATLPEDGEEIDITGGLMMRGNWMDDLPMVMVFSLNGEEWFVPDTSGHHNSHGGSWHEDHGCDYENPVAVGVEGDVAVSDNMHDHNMFWLDTNEDDESDYRLDFGNDDYNPGNGAERPQDGDWVEIIGGLIEGCPVVPTVVVYEINGVFWREPGDTTGLGPVPTSGILEDGESSILPADHVVIDSYPNPFNPATTVTLQVPSTQHVSVAVYDLTGREITQLLDGTLTAGKHSLEVDASSWASGVYFIKATGEGSTSVRRIQLVK